MLRIDVIRKRVDNYVRFRKYFVGIYLLQWYYCIHFCNTKKKSRLVSLKRRDGADLFFRSNSSDVWLVNSIIVGRNTHNKCIGDYDKVLQEINEIYDRNSSIMVLDAGANIGLFSILLLEMFHNARVIAVEADRKNYNVLIKNLERFGDRAICLNRGLWYRTCNLQIKNPEADDWGKIVEETNEITESSIPAITIEDIMELNDINSIDVVKMDIEGSEYYVFKHGNMEWINGLGVFVVETHDSFIDGTDNLVNNEMYKRGYNRKVFGENQVFIRNKES